MEELNIITIKISKLNHQIKQSFCLFEPFKQIQLSAFLKSEEKWTFKLVGTHLASELHRNLISESPRKVLH